MTSVVSDGRDEYVVRRFPSGDPAVTREVQVLPRLATLGELVPRLIGFDDALTGPVIVTSRVAGAAPEPGVEPAALAAGLAAALARIHAVDASGLPAGADAPPAGDTELAMRAGRDWPRLAAAPAVLTHSDFWSGNALWRGAELTGVVDWSGAHAGPRGLDVAWCRQDLVLLGSPAAADAFLAEYESRSGVLVDDVAAWDRYAAARADPNVESWAANYAGIGRAHLTGMELRLRFDRWTDYLLSG